uniref:Uncharacterized protein LOC117359417 n=1 Tax=Geotrypetes seraphini TaxID=260995 RepID=A0A6P8RAV9_GEOSA|nr:uncharacterized protein LOC117359417 [Geotrypetes seraphini]
MLVEMVGQYDNVGQKSLVYSQAKGCKNESKSNLIKMEEEAGGTVFTEGLLLAQQRLLQLDFFLYATLCNIEELLRRMQGVATLTSDVSPLRTPGLGETGGALLGPDTTLSPDIPQPQITSSPRGEVTPELGAVLSQEAAHITTESMETEFPAQGVSTEESEACLTTKGGANQTGQNQGNSSEGEHFYTQQKFPIWETPAQLKHWERDDGRQIQIGMEE